MRLFEICLGAAAGRDAKTPPGSRAAVPVGCRGAAELGALGRLELHRCWEGLGLGRVLGQCYGGQLSVQRALRAFLSYTLLLLGREGPASGNRPFHHHLPVLAHASPPKCQFWGAKGRHTWVSSLPSSHPHKLLAWEQKILIFFSFQASCHAASPHLPRGCTRHGWLAGMGVPGAAGLQHHPQGQQDGDRAVPGEPDPAVPLATALGKLRQAQPGGAGVVGPAAWDGMAGMGGRGRGEGHRCCGCVEPHRPVSPLTGEDRWAMGRTGCPALPYQPLPRVHALRCRARAVAQAPSLCVLRHLAPSTFVRAPPLCTLHHLARSIISHAPPSCVLHLCTRFIVGHAPSLRTLLCKLHRCARSVFVDAAARVFRRQRTLRRCAPSFAIPACGH